MNSLTLSLNIKDILNSDSITQFRNYISIKYMGSNHKVQATVLADAINKALERNMPNLIQEQKVMIRKHLIADAVSKPLFTISYSDMFCTILKCKILGNLFFKELTQWLSTALGQDIKRERVFDFVLRIHKSMEVFPTLDLKEIMVGVELEMGGVLFQETAVEEVHAQHITQQFTKHIAGHIGEAINDASVSLDPVESSVPAEWLNPIVPKILTSSKMKSLAHEYIDDFLALNSMMLSVASEYFEDFVTLNKEIKSGTLKGLAHGTRYLNSARIQLQDFMQMNIQTLVSFTSSILGEIYKHGQNNIYSFFSVTLEGLVTHIRSKMHEHMTTFENAMLILIQECIHRPIQFKKDLVRISSDQINNLITEAKRSLPGYPFHGIFSTLADVIGSISRDIRISFHLAALNSDSFKAQLSSNLFAAGFILSLYLGIAKDSSITVSQQIIQPIGKIEVKMALDKAEGLMIEKEQLSIKPAATNHITRDLGSAIQTHKALLANNVNQSTVEKLPVKPENGISPKENAKSVQMRATAYDLSYESCGKSRSHPEYGITRSGTRAKRGRTIAVDPKVIRLGSRVRVKFPENFSYLDGVYIAEDTGGAIKGNMIDVFLGEDAPGSKKVSREAYRFGIQKVQIQIIDS